MSRYEVELPSGERRIVSKSDRDKLLKQYGGSDQTLGEAVQADATGLASLDPTNPANMGRLLHHGVPMALQMGATALAPGSGTFGSAIGKVLGSGFGSLLGYLYQSGAEPIVQGQSPTTTPEGAAQSFGLGSLFEGAVQATGGVGRILSGKNAALQEGETAAQAALAGRADLAAKAEQDALKLTESARSKVVSAQDAVNREILKHSDDAFAGVKEAEVERMVKEGLGPNMTIQRPVSIDTLKAATAPAQKATQGAVKGVFGGISNQFEQALAQHGDLPIKESSLGPTIQVLRSDLKVNGRSLSPAMDKLLTEAEGGGGVVTARGANTADAQKIVDNLRRAGNDSAADELAQKFGLSTAGGATVRQQMGLRSRLVEQLHSKRGADRTAAATVIEAIDNDVAKVTPPELAPVLDSLRDDWHQAKSTLSDAFRNRLFRASSPEQVAEAIYTGAKTGKQMGHRAELLVNQLTKESPEQLPVLRQSFATMLANSPNAAAEIQKMSPSLFKAMFPGTGFDNPKNWVQALQGQNTFKQIAGSPELLGKYQSIFQQGMNSLGTKVKEQALAEAQSHLQSVPSSMSLLTNALKNTPSPAQAYEQGAMEGMKQPVFGKGMANYVEHKALYHAAIAMAGIGAYTDHSYLAIPLTYLGSSQAIGAALSNPTVGRMYYNALTSKTAEQGMFWLGRFTSAALSDLARDQ